MVVGDADVDKSALLHTANDSSLPLSSSGFRTKVVQLGGKRIQLQFWDISSTPDRSWRDSAFYEGADGEEYDYDTARRRSFDHCLTVASEVEQVGSPAPLEAMLVGGRSSSPTTEASREVDFAAAQELAAHKGIPLFIEAALDRKEGDNIRIDESQMERAFLELTSRIY